MAQAEHTPQGYNDDPGIYNEAWLRDRQLELRQELTALHQQKESDRLYFSGEVGDKTRLSWRMIELSLELEFVNGALDALYGVE